ncbi:MAG: glycosyltransferase family 4 protein [Candidatus Thorarchaeota archaeon]
MSKKSLSRMVVFVEHFPPFLGSDRSIYELARRVADKGVRIHFVATQPLRYLLGRRPSGWEYAKNWASSPPRVHPNITADYLLVNSLMEKMWRRFPPLALVFTVMLFTAYSLRPVFENRPEIIVAAHATPIVGIVSLLISKMTFRKLVIGCPDWMAAYAAELAGASLTSLGPALLQFVEVQLYKISDGVFAATGFLKKLLVSLGVPARKITIIPNGVDPSMFTPWANTSRVRDRYRLHDVCVILFSGHLEEWAGVSLLYDLAVRLENEYPDSRILLVGAGESIMKLYEKLIQRNLGYMLIHAGLQPYERMPEFTAVADIALCIFPNTPVAHAASPLKLFEYMAAGVAVVATAVSGTAEALDNGCGILVEPGNENAFSSAVLHLCRDSALRRQLGAAARDLVEKRYTWEKLAEKFMELCESIV